MFGRSGKYSTLAVLGCFLALAAAMTGAAAGFFYRWDVLALRDAFDLLRWAAYGGLGAGAVSVLGLIRSRPGSGRRGFVTALAGVCIGAAVFWVPYDHQQTARRVPAIHDITTDPADPPQFRAVLPLRPDSANSLEYGGAGLARQQRQAYPDIGPAVFDAPRDAVFSAALATAREMGWTVVDSAADDGRIEAVATTFWFGFNDDVVIRVTESGSGTRVDMRSVSRVGVSDVGTNAARIRAFLAVLKERA
ncbi:MAG: DUF1499 domain-containing protein [Gammaproteobacteria bacterium]|nr:DUF1499 domain-containing protein [Gammaproteobacteria bacterium]